jgi:hypothetical protein
MSGSNQDKLLADRVVALGIGEKDSFRRDMYCLGMFHSVRYEADKFVRDWRVAGALMEKVYFHSSGEFMVLCNSIKHIEVRSPDALTRAIIEGCVEVLERV